MKQIASFTVNHDVLKKGFYISRIDGDIATYDIRMAIPNSGAYLTNPAIHTFEHLFATYVRNSALTDSIVYVGPMGCRTGFYFLTRGITHQQALDLFRDTLEFISTFDAPIPGAQSSRECGNWLEHDLPGWRRMLRTRRVTACWRCPSCAPTRPKIPKRCWPRRSTRSAASRCAALTTPGPAIPCPIRSLRLRHGSTRALTA